jgi:sialic acid synthase SpsE
MLVVAEADVYHYDDLDIAMRLIDATADAGADAVKSQRYAAVYHLVQEEAVA